MVSQQSIALSDEGATAVLHEVGVPADKGPADDRAVAVDELRSAVGRRRERVVDHDPRPVRVGDLGGAGDVDNRHCGIGGGLDIDHLRVRVGCQLLLQQVALQQGDPRVRDAVLREDLVDQVVRRPVEDRLCNDVVSRPSEAQERGADSAHSRGEYLANTGSSMPKPSSAESFRARASLFGLPTLE